MHLRSLLLLAALALSAHSAYAEFRAGAATAEISPTQFPVSVNGGMKDRQVSTIHDPMLARAVALHDGQHTIILCTVDACVIPREICEEAKELVAKELKISKTGLLISATHTHTAATLIGVFQSQPDPAYVKTVAPRLAQGMIQAYRNLEPAELAWGVGSNPADVFNRRWHLKDGRTVENPFGELTDRVQMNPGMSNPNVSIPSGPVDQDVAVLAVRSVADGRPLAALVNYSLHYVGGLPAISADYFGVFCEELRGKLGGEAARYAGKPPFVGILTNGTSGNINNVNYGLAAALKAAEGEQIAAVSARLLDSTLAVYSALKWERSPTLASEERDLTLGVRRPTEAQTAQAREWLATIPKDRDGQWGNRKAIYALETVALAEWPATVPVKLQAHRIGQLSVAAIPCEVFVEIGLELKKETPFARHFTVSLANGYNGYLPTPEHHALGGYETWRARSSYLETGASPKINTALLEMLAALKTRTK